MKTLRRLLPFVILLFFATYTQGLNKNSNDSEESNQEIIYTTADLDQKYSVIEVIFGYEDFRSALRRPTERAYNAAWDSLKEAAEEVGADAVVGIKIQMENLTSDNVGRMLIYGTAVNFISEE